MNSSFLVLIFCLFFKIFAQQKCSDSNCKCCVDKGLATEACVTDILKCKFTPQSDFKKLTTSIYILIIFVVGIQ